MEVPRVSQEIELRHRYHEGKAFEGSFEGFTPNGEWVIHTPQGTELILDPEFVSARKLTANGDPYRSPEHTSAVPAEVPPTLESFFERTLSWTSEDAKEIRGYMNDPDRLRSNFGIRVDRFDQSQLRQVVVELLNPRHTNSLIHYLDQHSALMTPEQLGSWLRSIGSRSAATGHEVFDALKLIEKVREISKIRRFPQPEVTQLKQAISQGFGPLARSSLELSWGESDPGRYSQALESFEREFRQASWELQSYGWNTQYETYGEIHSRILKKNTNHLIKLTRKHCGKMNAKDIARMIRTVLAAQQDPASRNLARFDRSDFYRAIQQSVARSHLNPEEQALVQEAIAKNGNILTP